MRQPSGERAAPMKKQANTSEASDAPGKAGRPPKAGTAARETFQLRVTTEQRVPWQASAEARGQSESEWARDGLDAWVRICNRATQLGMDPRELVDVALTDHARVRDAIDQLARAELRVRRGAG
jgi:hypothetical protein